MPLTTTFKPSKSKIDHHHHGSFAAEALLALGTLKLPLPAVHSQMPLATRFKPSKSKIDQHRHVSFAAKALWALGTLEITLAAVHGPQMRLATTFAIESNN